MTEELSRTSALAGRHRMKKSLVLAHIRPDLIEPGTKINVSSDNINCSATVKQTPFYDPKKTKTHH